MTELDSCFEELLDDLDKDDADREKLSGNLKAGTIFVIDFTSTMVGTNNISNNTGFRLGVSCYQSFQKKKAIHEPHDVMALIFMRTREASAPDLKNIFIYQSLEQATIPSIQKLDHLLAMSFNDLNVNFGTITDEKEREFPMHELLSVCQSMFTTCCKNLGLKQIFLFTDDPDPVRGNIRLKRRAFARQTDLSEMNIELELIPVTPTKGSFNNELFYNFLFTGSHTNHCQFHTIDPDVRLDVLITRLLTFNSKRRSIARIPLYFGPSLDLSIKVSVYCILHQTRLPTPIRLTADDNQPVITSRLYHKMRNPQSLSSTSTKTTVGCDVDGVKSEEISTVTSDDIVRGLKVADRYICFKRSELSECAKSILPIGIIILGFTSKSFVKRHYFVRPSQFIYPDTTGNQSNRVYFTALLQCCLSRDLVIMCFYVQRSGLPPRFVALLPQSELKNDDIQLSPPGFHIIFLPFADDFRDLDLPGGQIVTDEQVDVSKSLVRKLTVPYDPRQIHNPTLQKFHATLEALALNQESNIHVSDETVPNIKVMKKMAGEEIETFIKYFNTKDSTSKSRKTGKAQSK